MAERTENPRRIPAPSVTFDQQVSQGVIPDMQATVPGDLTADVDKAVICIAKKAGKVRAVSIALASCGIDNDSDLTCEVDVFINGVTCLSTQPKIEYVSGEVDDTYKATMISGEFDGVTIGVVDPDANTFSRGDIITFDIDVALTAIPAGYMNGLGVLVEVDPIIPENA